MSRCVIEAEGLSKRYRLGRQDASDTLGGEVLGWLRSPLENYRRLRELTEFGDVEDESVLWALRDVSFSVQQGEILGVIGRNGAGKSTLLKLLSRITEPTSGHARLRGRVASLLEVGTGFHPDLTGRENIFLNGTMLGMSKREVEARFDEIVQFAEMERFIDTPVKRYSSGMYVRLAFGVAANLNPEILLVDEVLAVGDLRFQQKCQNKMGDVARAGRTILFVSHNLGAIRSLCSRVMLLDQGQVVFVGSVDEAMAKYAGDRRQTALDFDDGPLTGLELTVDRGLVRLTGSYRFDTGVPLPCLRFAVRDLWGQPILGSNPKMDGIYERRGQYGRTTVQVASPRLAPGTYTLSVWFGDGLENFVEYHDCMTFEVTDSTGAWRLGSSIVGPVIPECQWSFEDAHPDTQSDTV